MYKQINNYERFRLVHYLVFIECQGVALTIVNSGLYFIAKTNLYSYTSSIIAEAFL